MLHKLSRATRSEVRLGILRGSDVVTLQPRTNRFSERVRTDVIDAAGVITIRYNSRLHHIGLSKRRRGTKVTVLIDDRDIRVLDRDTGQLIRNLILDPNKDYQPRGVKCGNSRPATLELDVDSSGSDNCSPTMTSRAPTHRGGQRESCPELPH